MKNKSLCLYTSEKKIIEELEAYVSLSFIMFGDMSVKEISRKTKLSLSTIYKYRRIFYNRERIPKRMHGLTLIRFGAAAGLTLEYNNGIPKTSLKK